MPQARPEIRAAKEPLTTDEFKRALEQGLGRAILCLKKHDPMPYKEIILETCLKDLAQPCHFSHDKGHYFNELLSCFDDALDLKNQILYAFQSISPDEDKRPSRKLILEFAKTGLANARDALYDDFQHTLKTDFDRIPGQEIVELDGLSGLLKIAPFLGMLVDSDFKDQIPWYHIRDFSATLGDEVVNKGFSELKSLKAVKYAQKYLEFSRARHQSFRENKGLNVWGLPVDWALKAIADGSVSHFMLGVWGQHAKTKELVQVAESIAKIRGAKKLARALSVFAKEPLPLNYNLLLKFCCHKDEKVVWYAC